MIAVDTDVWARAILADDPRQSRAAQKVLAQATEAGGVFVPLLVLVELAWVLKAAPGWDPDRVRQSLDRLLNMEGVEVEASQVARDALALSGGSVGLSDNLIALGAQARGCSKLLTFDVRFSRTGRAELLKA